MKNHISPLLMYSLCCIIFSSCSKTEILDVAYNFGNFNGHADLSEAIYKGIEIPTQNQIQGGKFIVSFKVTGNPSKKYFYKIYYQNESYKFPETKGIINQYNPPASENFYGSWANVSIGFKPVPALGETIIDSINIVGNPRDEKKYYGEPFANSYYNVESVEGMILSMKNSPEWYAAISEKAKKNQVAVDEQLLQDARWVLRNKKEEPVENNRWKRNPRMGKYSLMLVVTSEDGLATIPPYIQHINLNADNAEDSLQHENFVNPYCFFSNATVLNKHRDTKIFVDSSFFTVSALLNPSSGVYVSNLDYTEAVNTENLINCGENRELYHNALFAQFFSTSFTKTFRLNTIPVVQDVNDSSYTLKEYEASTKKFSEEDMKQDYIRNTDSPCKYVRYDNNKKAIEIVNPGNENIAEAHKTNMGVKTRIGFTYGKITAKIKFPELVNKYNVWNGLTNAFWLLFQSETEWNFRRKCKAGYTKKGESSKDSPRIEKTFYSEIDFEIVKAGRYWPKTSYGHNRKIIPTEDAQKTNEIMVACTNWDMSCGDCKTYTVGVDSLLFENNFFEVHRWDTWYQALTTKTPAEDDELFKRPYYFYQFEWTPEYIIWRIGPEKNQLRTVGYMNSEVTAIPNNQMIAIVTQEYHLSEWWPPIPFRQEYIPFPKNNIMGEVYEITVE